MKLRILCAMAASLALSGGFAADAAAQGAYPDRPITMMVPAAAGGPSDTIARLVAQAMSANLGQQVIIENMGGAGGSLGAGKVASAKPDGYTVLLYHIGVATFAALYPNLPYKPSELESIGLVTEAPMTIVARTDLPPANAVDMLAFVKKEGEKLTFGTAGVGAASHLCDLLFMRALEVKITLVPYKGTGPAMTDLVGKRIDMMCDQATNTASQIAAGQIKAYAVTARERIPVFKELPTLQEAGLKGFDMSAWHGIWAPKGTPDAIRQKLSASLQAALKDPIVIERFASLGTTPVAAELATPAAMDKHFKSELKLWGEIIAKADIKGQ